MNLCRRFVVIWMILSVAPLAGGAGETVRVVTVTGDRLHLRAQLPLTLDHRGVKRHLSVGERFGVEKIGYGLRHTGRGHGDVWFYVRSLRDPDEEGWVHSRWLVDLSQDKPERETTPETATKTFEPVAMESSRESLTHAESAPETGSMSNGTMDSAASKPTAAPAAADERGLPPVIVLPPPEWSWLPHATNIFSLLASVMTMAALSLPSFLRSTPEPAPPPVAPRHVIGAPVGRSSHTRQPNFYYGRNWHTSARR